MLLSVHRLDHLSQLTDPDLSSGGALIDSEYVSIPEGVFPNQSYVVLDLEIGFNLDEEIIKVVISHFCHIYPDSIVAFDNKRIPLKDNRSLTVLEGVYRKINGFDFREFSGWKAVSPDLLSILALSRHNNVNIDNKLLFGRYLVVSEDSEKVEKIRESL